MADRDFWDEIMVNTYDIDINDLPLNDLIEEFKSRVGNDICFFKLLCNRNQLNFKPGMSCGQLINGILQKNREFIIDLLGLIRFKYRKRYDVIKEISMKCLDPATRDKCTFTGSAKTGKFSYYALLFSLLFIDGGEPLKNIFYKDFSANKGFKYYRLSPNVLPSVIPDISKISPESIDVNFLDEFERIRNEKKESRCWHITGDKDHAEIFVRRDTTEGYVPEVHGNFRAKFSEYIIMKFLEKGGFLELHSTHLKPPGSIANHFAIKLFGKDYRYYLVEGKVKKDTAQEFIKSVSTAADDEFILFYVRVRNVNLPTLPRLVVENTTGDSIVSDIDRLKREGIDLLKSIEDIERMEFIFKNTRIPIFIRMDGNRAEFLYQYNRLDDNTRREFIEHMYDNYAISVIPSK